MDTSTLFSISCLCLSSEFGSSEHRSQMRKLTRTTQSHVLVFKIQKTVCTQSRARGAFPPRRPLRRLLCIPAETSEMRVPALHKERGHRIGHTVGSLFSERIFTRHCGPRAHTAAHGPAVRDRGPLHDVDSGATCLGQPSLLSVTAAWVQSEHQS